MEATLANSTCSIRIQWPWSCPGRGLSNHERRSIISYEIASCGLESNLGELCDFKFGVEATLANSICSIRIEWPWSCPGRGLSNHERRSISYEIASCGLESHLGELCDFKFGMEATLANSRVSDPGCKHRFSRPWRTLGSGAELCSWETACSQGD